MDSVPILYDDNYITVCVKPAGIISEDGGMPDILKEQTGADRILCVHRLDRDVCGIMVYAKNTSTAAALSSASVNGDLQKVYLAICAGITDPAGRLDDLLFHDRSKNKTYVVKRSRKGVKDASLEYRRLSILETEAGMFSLVQVRLITGRTHQIRVQFASRSHPLAGDRRYGSTFHEHGLLLCCAELRFTHPNNGTPMSFRYFPTGGFWDAAEIQRVWEDYSND